MLDSQAILLAVVCVTNKIVAMATDAKNEMLTLTMCLPLSIFPT